MKLCHQESWWHFYYAPCMVYFYWMKVPKEPGWTESSSRRQGSSLRNGIRIKSEIKVGIDEQEQDTGPPRV